MPLPHPAPGYLVFAFFGKVRTSHIVTTYAYHVRALPAPACTCRRDDSARWGGRSARSRVRTRSLAAAATSHGCDGLVETDRVE